jgi:hypothetical protein
MLAATFAFALLQLSNLDGMLLFCLLLMDAPTVPMMILACQLLSALMMDLHGSITTTMMTMAMAKMMTMTQHLLTSKLCWLVMHLMH